MSEPKWTKGPWGNSSTGVQMRSFSQSRAIFQEGKANLIASVFSDVAGGKETAEANARLIAAAPELYEALDRLIVACGEGDRRGRAIDLIDKRYLTAAVKALAKALGE